MSHQQCGAVMVALLTMPKVENLVGFKKSTIYNLIKDGKFPTPVQVGPRRICFRSDEIDRWIKARPRAVLHVNSDTLIDEVEK